MHLHNTISILYNYYLTCKTFLSVDPFPQHNRLLAGDYLEFELAMSNQRVTSPSYRCTIPRMTYTFACKSLIILSSSLLEAEDQRTLSNVVFDSREFRISRNEKRALTMTESTCLVHCLKKLSNSEHSSLLYLLYSPFWTSMLV